MNVKLALLLVAGSSTCHAADGIESCEKIVNKAKRLECFEVFAKQYSKPPSESPKTETAEDEFTRSAKSAVSSKFFDPGGTNYKDLSVVEKSQPKGTSISLCGELNAKNRFGGFIGFQRFVVFKGKERQEEPAVLLERDPTTSREAMPIRTQLFEQIWTSYCVK